MSVHMYVCPYIPCPSKGSEGQLEEYKLEEYKGQLEGQLEGQLGWEGLPEGKALIILWCLQVSNLGALCLQSQTLNIA